MRRLRVISLLLNGVLFALLARRALLKPDLAFAREPRMQMTQAGSLRATRHAPRPTPDTRTSATPWDALEARDTARFIANLRAVGCPEQTIRDIVTLQLGRDYRRRLVAEEAEAARSWRFTRNRGQEDWWQQRDRLSELRIALDTELESRFGDAAGKLKGMVLGWPGRLDSEEPYLTWDKRARLREIDSRFQRLFSEAREDPFGPSDPESQARRRELEREKAAAVAAILTPTEFEDYQMRESPAARYVRSSLPAAKSEAEFRAMVKVAAEFDLGFNPVRAAARYGMAPDDPEEARAREERQAAFQQRLREVLGEPRVAEQQQEERDRQAREQERQRLQDERRERARIAAMAEAAGVSSDEANRFVDRLKELEPTLSKKFEEMEKSLKGSEGSEAKAKAIKAAIQAEMETIAVEVMGEKGRALIKQMLKESGEDSTDRP